MHRKRNHTPGCLWHLKKVLSLVFLFALGHAWAQTLPSAPNRTDPQGRRQGHWVIWFNQNWKETRVTDSVGFYRVIDYKDDLPVSTVTDHFRNGTVQFQGTMLRDRPAAVYDGKVTWYHENGRKKMEVIFEQGAFRKLESAFLSDGKPGRPDYDVVFKEAYSRYENEQYQAAGPRFEETLGHMDIYKGKKNADYLFVERLLVDNCFAEEDYQRAVRFSEELVRLDQLVLPPADTMVMDDIANWALAASLSGTDTKELERIYELGYRISKKVGPCNASVSVLGDLGDLYRKRAAYDEAAAVLNEALQLADKIQNREITSRQLMVILSLVDTYGSRSEIEAQNILIRKTLTNLSRTTSHIEENRLLTRILAQNLNVQGKWKESLQVYFSYLDLLAQTGQSNSMAGAAAHTSIGNLFLSTGNLPSAETAFQTASGIISSSKEAKDEQRYALYSGYMKLYEELGQQTQVEKYYSLSKALHLDATGQLELAMDRVVRLIKNKQNKTAISMMEKMISSMGSSEVDPNGIPLSSVLRLTLTQLRLQQADSIRQAAGPGNENFNRYYDMLKQTSSSIDQAIRELKGPDWAIRMMRPMMQLFQLEIYRKLDDRRFETVLPEMIRGTLGAFPKTSKQTIDLLYYAMREMQFTDRYPISEFAEGYRSVFLLMSVYRQQTLPFVTEAVRTSFITTSRDVLEQYTSLLLNKGRENEQMRSVLYNELLRSKGLVIKSIAQTRRQVEESNDPEVARLFNDLSERKSKLANLVSFSGSEQINAHPQITKLEVEVASLEKALAIKTGHQTMNPADTSTSWRAISARLKAGEAAIELFRGKTGDAAGEAVYLALVIRPEWKAPKMAVLPDAAAMEVRSLNFYRNAIRYRLTDTLSYESYWRGFDELLRGVKRAWVSPDGVYHQVSLATLFNKRTGKFLADELDLRVVNSTADLLQAEPEVPAVPGHLVLVGFPEFGDMEQGGGTSMPNRSMNLNNIPPLPGTRDEISGVATLLTKKGLSVRKLTGADATEAAIKAIRDPYVLHIATHGYFLKDTSVKTGGEINLMQQKTVAGPMMRSGLLLSSCCNSSVARPNSGDDGILTAYEASSMSLNHTRLVVLSACETGLGEISYGEGVYGLQRAFFEAGVPGLLMSLWKVDDQATQRLMNLFYQNWLGSRSTQDALQKASAQLRREYPDPFYWGAFVAVGK